MQKYEYHLSQKEKATEQIKIDIARTLSQVRIYIYVERVIGLVRQKYSILQSTLPVSLFQSDGSFSSADKIVTINFVVHSAIAVIL